ncbi:MAG: glutathione S-transferase [SAR324 cluster bacterium]|nr:glutathione S-transferase [SAR324 cluster bacterium]
MKLKLIYPDISFWRAETSRLALFIGGIEFEDVRPSREEITKMKTDGTFPFGQCPVLQVDGKTIAQTGAIARFCGKLSGLYPSDNNFAAAKADEVIDLCTDITIQMRPALRESDPKLRTEMRKELSETILPHWLAFLEKLLQDNGDTGFFVADSISVADLAVWRLCGWISGGVIDGIPTNLLEGFPLLSVHHQEISNLPKVMEWVKKTHK